MSDEIKRRRLALEFTGGGGNEMEQSPATVNPVDYLYQSVMRSIYNRVLKPVEDDIMKRVVVEARTAFSYGKQQCRAIASRVVKMVLNSGAPEDHDKAIPLANMQQEGGLGGQLVPPNKVMGGRKRKRFIKGFLAPYMENVLYPVVDTFTPLVLGGHLYLTSATAYNVTSPTAASVHNFQTDGNRAGQFILAATLLPTEFKSFLGTAMIMQRSTGAGLLTGTGTTDGSMFSNQAEDDVAITTSLTNRQADRLVEFNKLDFSEWSDFYSVTNTQNTVANVTIIVYESRSFHNEGLNGCLAADLLEYNNKRNAFIALNPGFDTNMEVTSALYDPTKTPYFGVRSRKYWRITQKKEMILSAFETCRLVTSGLLGVVPGGRMCRNVSGHISSALANQTDNADFDHCPGSRVVVIRWCGGELAYNAAVNVQQPGLCSAEITLTMGRHLVYRRLPPSRASSHRPVVVDSNVPPISAVNARVYDADTNTYVVPVTAEP